MALQKTPQHLKDIKFHITLHTKKTSFNLFLVCLFFLNYNVFFFYFAGAFFLSILSTCRNHRNFCSPQKPSLFYTSVISLIVSLLMPSLSVLQQTLRYTLYFGNLELSFTFFLQGPALGTITQGQRTSHTIFILASSQLQRHNSLTQYTCYP